VVKAYTDEKEKSKLPGYVCTYDEFDYDDDVPASYGSTVAEMGKAVKAHGPHPTPKGTHFHTSDAPSQTAKAAKPDDFADGIA
jgi:stage V sporulation protein G